MQRRIRFVQAHLVATLYLLVNSFLRTVRVLLWPRRRPSNPRRICVYRIGFVGDTVVSLPAISAIRTTYPDAHITLLTSPVEGKFPGARELLQNSQLVDELRVYLKSEVTGFRNRFKFLRSMRSEHFDIWIDLPQELPGPIGQLRNMLIARLIGVKWGYGWGFVTTIRLWVQAQSECLVFENQVDKLLGIVRRAGMVGTSRVRFPIELSLTERDKIDTLLGADPGAGRLVAIAPGAKRNLSIWPAERFVLVGRYLATEGFRIVILGGAADAPACRVVAEGIGGDTINLGDRTSLKESCEVLRRSLFLVCNDSGVQHLAAAVGTPCISLFSAHDMPGKWSPYGDQNISLRKWVECHTCYLQVCPNKNRCLTLIEVEEVIAAVKAKMSDLLNTDSTEHTVNRTVRSTQEKLSESLG